MRWALIAFAAAAAAGVHAHQCVHDEVVRSEPKPVIAPQHYPNQLENERST